MRCSWQFKDDDPQNQAVINPCFRRQMDLTDPLSGTDAQALCDDLATGLEAWLTAISGAHKQLTVTAYNIEGTPPNRPLAQKKVQAGVYGLPVCPPELACCLSFYGTQNIPRQRGRLYVPVFLLNLGANEVSAPVIGSPARDKVAQLVAKFAALGGTNVDWIVWSQVAHAATKVQNYWIDEAWDTMRSRGLKATARTTGTTSG